MTAPVNDRNLQNKIVPFIPRQDLHNVFMRAPLQEPLVGNDALMLTRGRIEGKIEGFGDWLRARNGHPIDPDNKEVRSQLFGIAESMAEYKSLFGNHHEMRTFFMKASVDAIVENEMHKFSQRVDAAQARGRDFAHFAPSAEAIAKHYAIETTAKLDAALLGHVEARAAAVAKERVA